MLRVNTKPRKRNSPRPAEKSAPGFLQWLRGRECLCAKTGLCSGKAQAAHVDYAGGKGVGTKVADRWAVPLCAFHHAIQHREGWHSFDAKYLDGENAGLAAANQFWRAWPGRIAWEAKQDGA